MTDQMIREFWQMKRLNAGLAEQRALQPVVTALLQHNHKQAILTCEKALRLKPYNPSVQILHAIALCRAGSSNTEGINLALEVAKDVKGDGKALKDPYLLHMCSYILKGSNDEYCVVEMWERASSLFPENLELALEASKFLVRVGGFGPAENICKRTLSYKPVANIPASEDHLELLYIYITCILIQAGDLHVPHAKTRWKTMNTTSSTPETVHTSLLTALGYFNKAVPGDAALPGCGPTNSTDADIQWVVDERVASNTHTFYLLIKILKYLSDTPNNLETIKINTKSARLRLIETLQSARGRKYSQDDLQIDLFRREALLRYGGEKEWNELYEEMLAKLEKGDPNWATIETAIFAAYACATGTAIFQNSSVETIPEQQKIRASPDTWWKDVQASASNGESEENGDAISEKTDDKGRNPHSFSSNHATHLLVRLKKCLEALAADDGFSKKERGYTLGLLKLACLLPDQGQKLLPDLVVLYLKRFANRACCVDDLKEYLPKLDAKGRETVLQWIHATFDTETINIGTLHDLECSITIEKIKRYMQTTYATLEKELQVGHFYAKAYFDALHFGKDLEATDLQPADDLALLAAQCYVSAWELSQYDGQYLELAIGLLEFALRKSRYRYQMRILLISLYRVAGAPLMALKHYIMLDIKQVQLDTLGHWALDRGATFCAPEDMDKPAKSREEMSYSEITSRTAEWYPMADEEVSISLSHAWSKQVYSVLEDMTTFQDRLSHSLSRWLVHLESLRSMLCFGKYDSDMQNFANASMRWLLEASVGLRDNRDYSVLPNYQPSAQNGVIEQVRMGPQIDEAFLRRFVSTYVAFLNPDKELVQGLRLDDLESEPPASCTEWERKLFLWAGPIVNWLTGVNPDMETVKPLQFIKDAQAELASRTVDQPLWITIQIAQLALESYTLLDLAFAGKTRRPANFKYMKQLKQIRQDANSVMKAVSSRLKVMAEDLSRKYKARKKLDALVPLKQYEPVSEDLLLDVATQLLETRKRALTLLALRISKRISDNARSW